MFEFIKPEDRTRWGVIALIILFVLSSAAVYMNSGFNLSGGSTGNTGNSGGNGLDTFNGTASANATLVSWDPTLTVVGNSPQLEELVQQLKGQGIVTYDVSTPDGRILRLAHSSDVFPLTAQLTALNLTAYDEGVISIPDVRVTGGGISRTVPGSTFRYTTVPIFAEGDVFPLSFSAEVVNGQLQSLGNIQIGAGQAQLLEVAPQSAQLNATFWRAMIPWSARNVNGDQLQANLPGGSTVSYGLKSYVSFDPPLTASQLQQLGASMPPYAVSLQPALMGVDLAMTNQSRVRADLAALDLNATFPDSPMDIRAYRQPGQSESEWLMQTQAVFNQTFPRLVVNFTPTYRLELTLPENIGPYLVANRTLDLNSLYPPTEGYTVKLVFTPVGRRIVQFTQAEYSPASAGFVPLASAENSSVGNGSIPGPQTGTRAQNYTGELPPGAG